MAVEYRNVASRASYSPSDWFSGPPGSDCSNFCQILTCIAELLGRDSSKTSGREPELNSYVCSFSFHAIYSVWSVVRTSFLSMKQEVIGIHCEFSFGNKLTYIQYGAWQHCRRVLWESSGKPLIIGLQTDGGNSRKRFSTCTTAFSFIHLSKCENTVRENESVLSICSRIKEMSRNNIILESHLNHE